MQFTSRRTRSLAEYPKNRFANRLAKSIWRRARLDVTRGGALLNWTTTWRDGILPVRFNQSATGMSLTYTCVQVVSWE